MEFECNKKILAVKIRIETKALESHAIKYNLLKKFEKYKEICILKIRKKTIRPKKSFFFWIYDCIPKIYTGVGEVGENGAKKVRYIVVDKTVDMKYKR